MAEIKEKKKPHRGRRRKKKSSVLSNIILLIAVIVFCVSGFQLFQIGKGYMTGRSEYKKLEELAITEGNPDTFRVNFEELLSVNPDTIGWLRFYPEPSVINYPIVQGKDNQEYLHKTFSANENTMGAIFLSADNSPAFTDRNSVIYGHRMKDGSMFRHLSDYEDQSFWKENPYFYIYTPDNCRHKYHIYSVGQVEDMTDTYLTQFESDEAFQSFLRMTKETALYDTGVEPAVYDKVVTLSTCTSANDNHRFVVRGILEETTELK